MVEREFGRVTCRRLPAWAAALSPALAAPSAICTAGSAVSTQRGTESPRLARWLRIGAIMHLS
jgi:hypothetical protein